jgi:hypothetical protein
LNWKTSDELPLNIKKSKIYEKWIRNTWNQPPEWFAKIDIDDSDKTQEILIASSLSGSGGRNFLLITQTKNNEWNELAFIFGAPIFMKSNPSGYADLQTYHRDGAEMWLRSFKYINGKYKVQTQTLLPRSIVTECFYQNWLKLNLLNNFSTSSKALKCA